MRTTPATSVRRKSVDREPADELAADVQVDHRRVVAEEPRRPGGEGCGAEDPERDERQALRAEDAAPVDGDRRHDERREEHDVLDPRERREEREREEHDLRAPRRSLDRHDSGRDGAERQWIRHRVRERVRREVQVGNRHREERAHERVAL